MTTTTIAWRATGRVIDRTFKRTHYAPRERGQGLHSREF